MVIFHPAQAHPTQGNRQRISQADAQPLAERILAPANTGSQKTMLDFWISQKWYRICKDGARGAILAEISHKGCVTVTNIKLKIGNWKEEGTRKEAIRFLVKEVLGKNPRDIRKEDFERNKLSGLLSRYYKNFPYKALLAAGFRLHPWEMPYTPRGFLDLEKVRIRATKWLVRKLNKSPNEIAAEDFENNRLGGMLMDHYGGSPFRALKEAGLMENPWEMKRNPFYYLDNPGERINAIKWMAARIAKPARDATASDFEANGLGGMLCQYYVNSPYEAMLHAGLVSPADEEYMRTRNQVPLETSARGIARAKSRQQE